jgi:hypothetical protein
MNVCICKCVYVRMYHVYTYVYSCRVGAADAFARLNACVRACVCACVRAAIILHSRTRTHTALQSTSQGCTPPSEMGVKSPQAR